MGNSLGLVSLTTGISGSCFYSRTSIRPKGQRPWQFSLRLPGSKGKCLQGLSLRRAPHTAANHLSQCLQRTNGDHSINHVRGAIGGEEQYGLRMGQLLDIRYPINSFIALATLHFPTGFTQKKGVFHRSHHSSLASNRGKRELPQPVDSRFILGT